MSLLINILPNPEALGLVYDFLPRTFRIAIKSAFALLIVFAPSAVFAPFAGGGPMAEAAETRVDDQTTTDQAKTATIQTTVGFDSTYKTGAWTPVRVTVPDLSGSTPAKIQFRAADDEGIPCVFENEVIEVAPAPTAPSGSRTFEGFVSFGRRPAVLDVTLSCDGQQPWTDQWRPAHDGFVASTQQWILVIGAKPLQNVRQRSLATAARLLDRPRGQEVRVLHLDDVNALPHRWMGYNAFDMIVMAGSAPGKWGQIQPSQWTAIRNWTKLGGRLMTCVGEHADELFSNPRITDLVPGEFVEQVVVPATTKLEEFSGASDRLDVLLENGRWPDSWRTSTGQGGVPMALLRDPLGTVLVGESFRGGSIPLLVRDRYGLGERIFLALDIDSEPLRQWSGYHKFLMRLLKMTVDQQTGEQEAASGRVTHLGFGDISGQLRTALEQFPGVRLVPFALIGVFAACYVLLIGPLEYFGLSKLNDRMHWTWLTFPLSVAAVCGLSLFFVNQWKGTERKVNQIDLIDWDTETGVVRGTQWSHFYSPTSTVFDCQFDFVGPAAEVAQGASSLLIWDGLPGISFGGMDASSPLRPYTSPYRIQVEAGSNKPSTDQAEIAGTRIESIPLPVASSRAIRGTWWNLKAPEVDSDFRAQADTYLQGSFTNPFQFEIRDSAIAYDRWYYKVGRVAANAPVTIERDQTPLGLKSQLIGRVVADDRHSIAPWQQTNFDVSRIMEMIMFQGAAGGENYTRLVHRHHGELDFTPQLAAGKAVFVGQIRTPATQLNDTEFSAENGQNWTYVRLVLPVDAYSSIPNTDVTMTNSSREVAP